MRIFARFCAALGTGPGNHRAHRHRRRWGDDHRHGGGRGGELGRWSEWAGRIVGELHRRVDRWLLEFFGELIEQHFRGGDHRHLRKLNRGELREHGQLRFSFGQRLVDGERN
jgi:hypothetical protein